MARMIVSDCFHGLEAYVVCLSQHMLFCVHVFARIPNAGIAQSECKGIMNPEASNR